MLSENNVGSVVLLRLNNFATLVGKVTEDTGQDITIEKPRVLMFNEVEKSMGYQRFNMFTATDEDATFNKLHDLVGNPMTPAVEIVEQYTEIVSPIARAGAGGIVVPANA